MEMEEEEKRKIREYPNKRDTKYSRPLTQTMEHMLSPEEGG